MAAQFYCSKKTSGSAVYSAEATLGGYQLHSNEKVEVAVNAQPDFYHKEISKFVPRWYKCVKLLRNCAEK
jgi:hypothetical protein